jgi:hypothetical protein
MKSFREQKWEMNVSSLNNDNCFALTGNETHFCGVFQRTPMKTAVIFTSSLLTWINIVLLCGSIWYQLNGSDNKKTLTNRLFTSLCYYWTGSNHHWLHRSSALHGWTLFPTALHTTACF